MKREAWDTQEGREIAVTARDREKQSLPRIGADQKSKTLHEEAKSIEQRYKAKSQELMANS